MSLGMENSCYCRDFSEQKLSLCVLESYPRRPVRRRESVTRNSAAEDRSLCAGSSLLQWAHMLHSQTFSALEIWHRFLFIHWSFLLSHLVQQTFGNCIKGRINRSLLSWSSGTKMIYWFIWWEIPEHSGCNNYIAVRLFSFVLRICFLFSFQVWEFDVYLYVPCWQACICPPLHWQYDLQFLRNQQLRAI